jgi:predicted ATPase/DNA-binding SARP family transcriptional activator
MEEQNRLEGKVKVSLFGSPRLEKDGKAVSFDTRKALALLAYLILGETGAVSGFSRDSLAALLYPEADQTSARAALRRTLSSLRKGIGSDCLRSEGERVELKAGCAWVDVLAFRGLVSQMRGHGHASGTVCRECLPLLESCVRLAESDFLAGFSLRDSPQFDDWQQYQTETLRLEQAGCLEKLSLGLAAQGDFDSAVRYARRWLALDALREEAHRHLMRLYAWKGERSAALRQYRDCVRVLEHELGTPPLEETQQLYQDLIENKVPPLPILAEFAPAAVAAVRPDAKQNAPDVPRALPATSIPGYPLVGRDQELEALLRAYAQAGEQGFFFVLEGEAGIGKSRLAQEFIQQAQARGAAVMQARGYEGQSGLAYAPFTDGLNALLAHGPAQERLEHIPPAALSLAAQIVPALAERFPGLPPVADPSAPGIQVRFFEALRQVIIALLAPPAPDAEPGILFLDDLQWADQASIDLLAYLTRRLGGIFLLAAWRSGSIPPDHLLHHLRLQNEREKRGAGLYLSRLLQQDIARLLQSLSARVPQQFAEHLYRETEGSPFFVVEYLEALRQHNEELASRTDALAWETPPGVRGLLQAHLDGAGELGRQMLSAAAVVGRSFDFETLQAASGRSEEETVAGLEALIQQGLVVEQQAGDPYDFTHDKLRSLVYEQTSHARRRLLHRRAAELYARQARLKRESAALAARHYQQAGQYPEAARWFQEAGEYARSVYANQEAINHFQHALAYGHPDTAGLQEAVGDLHMLSGSYPAALESYQAAAALCSSEHLPRIEHKLGRVYDERGEWDLAQCYFKSALEYMEERQEAEDAAEKSLIYADWSRTAYRQGKLDEALELASQALGLAEASSSAPALAQAHNTLGILARSAGSFADAIQHLQHSLEISRARQDAGREAAALNNLARVYAESGQTAHAIQLTIQALEICQARGDRHREAALHTNLADLYHQTGQESAAIQQLTQSVAIMAEIGGEPQGELLPEIWKLVEW